MATFPSAQRIRQSPFIVTAAAWSIVAAIFIGQNVVRELTQHRDIQWKRDVFAELLYWIAFALLTPIIAWLCRRYSLSGGHRQRAFTAHFVAAPVVASIQVLVYFALLIAATPIIPGLFAANVPNSFDKRVSLFLLLGITAYWKYWVIVGLIHGIAYARLYYREQQTAADLRAQLSDAQLDRLKAQLQPHFLFNTLNSIAVLLRDDPERARTMLLRLSEMLRVVVDAGSEQFVPLSRELAFVRQYLDIQQMRFGERLSVALEISPDMGQELVPHFLIQPLVENAVQHGISTIEHGGTVAVRARKHDGELHVEVLDTPNVPAERASSSNGTGVGLSNTRQRLAKLYEGAADLTIAPVDGGGTRVTVRVPARSSDR
ncbi:MAG: sensor histidine kinase [Gemmatimonadaceae bacterium]